MWPGVSSIALRRIKIWVRTKDWVAQWEAPGTPGRFQVVLNDKPLETTFGTVGAQWHWQDGGKIDLPEGTLRLALHDLTGFEGRCDAILFSSDPSFVPPNTDPKMLAFRRRCVGQSDQPERAGEYDLVVQADRFKSWHTRLAVVANQPQKLETIRLQPADGKLAIRTRPAGANVMIGKKFAGQTPLTLTLTAHKTHLLQMSKAGYEKAKRTVKLLSEESKALSITLKPKLGVINFEVKPPDANLILDGRSLGRVPPNLDLVAIEHQLEIRKQGYRPYRTRLTPRPGFPQEINITLSKLSSSPGTPAGIIRARNGYELKLVQPGVFSMGSSRREQGRRSNETLRKIKLQRPFYMGIREVTNKEVRQFLTAHNSGAFKTQSLNRDQLPAVAITWQQAALFCNWLSVKESLQPVYVQKGGRLTAADPVGNGYRLPTEAEWEYCARFNRKRDELKYPWGTGYPPPADAGNFADTSAKGLMTNYLATYNDRYAISAPPSKFKKNALGLYDMGGNVAEWCHDYYSIYPYNAQKIYIDPMGPAEGKHHVIKGSSWMHAGISELRLSYRDYSDTKRPDLGFRIGRYLK